MKSQTKRLLFLATYLAIFQIAFIILMGFFASYNTHEENEVPRLYSSKSPLEKLPPLCDLKNDYLILIKLIINFFSFSIVFMDVHTMMFIGFGFLMTFLKRYGYSAVGFNFLIAAYVLEWALLVRGWLHSSSGVFSLNIERLELKLEFC